MAGDIAHRVIDHALALAQGQGSGNHSPQAVVTPGGGAQLGIGLG